MTLTFCARLWPRLPFDQLAYAEQLEVEMAAREFGEEWHPDMRRTAGAVVKAVNQVLVVTR